MKTTELRAKKPAELQQLLADTQKELNDAQRGLHAGELANPRVIRAKRRLIAQIKTVANEPTANEEKS
jgi:ribosomal protein L29